MLYYDGKNNASPIMQIFRNNKYSTISICIAQCHDWVMCTTNKVFWSPTFSNLTHLVTICIHKYAYFKASDYWLLIHIYTSHPQPPQPPTTRPNPPTPPTTHPPHTSHTPPTNPTHHPHTPHTTPTHLHPIPHPTPHPTHPKPYDRLALPSSIPLV